MIFLWLYVVPTPLNIPTPTLQLLQKGKSPTPDSTCQIHRSTRPTVPMQSTGPPMRMQGWESVWKGGDSKNWQKGNELAVLFGYIFVFQLFVCLFVWFVCLIVFGNPGNLPGTIADLGFEVSGKVERVGSGNRSSILSGNLSGLVIWQAIFCVSWFAYVF